MSLRCGLGWHGWREELSREQHFDAVSRRRLSTPLRLFRHCPRCGRWQVAHRGVVAAPEWSETVSPHRPRVVRMLTRDQLVDEVWR